MQKFQHLSDLKVFTTPYGWYSTVAPRGFLFPSMSMFSYAWLKEFLWKSKYVSGIKSSDRRHSMSLSETFKQVKWVKQVGPCLIQLTNYFRILLLAISYFTILLAQSCGLITAMSHMVWSVGSLKWNQQTSKLNWTYPMFLSVLLLYVGHQGLRVCAQTWKSVCSREKVSSGAYLAQISMDFPPHLWIQRFLLPHLPCFRC